MAITAGRMRHLKEFLTEMTAVAIEYDIVIGEPIEASSYSYQPEFGMKLYWDNSNKRYVFFNGKEIIS